MLIVWLLLSPEKLHRAKPFRCADSIWQIPGHLPTFGYLSDLGECIGDHALVEIRRFQMAEKPPSTDNSTPFT